MKTLFLFTIAFVLATGFARVSIADQPNVLFIAIDDLNDWVGCLNGHPQAKTPNINALAERGILFTNAHCAAPACNPSRSAVFSGRMPNHTGVWSNDSAKLSRLQPDVLQLPAAFSRAGYLTLGTGKLSGDKSTRYDERFDTNQRWSPFPADQVNYTDEELPSKGTENPHHKLIDSKGRTVVLPINRMPSDRASHKRSGESFDWGAFDVPDSDFGDTRITNWALDKINSLPKRPVFLGVGYYRPHIPLFAPKRFFKRFQSHPGILPPFRQDDLSDVSNVARRWALEPITAGRHATVVRHNQWQKAVEAYLACVSYIDHEVGRLITAIDDSSAAENTLIVLWSDHGWHLGEKQHWGKWTPWERSTRVPLIVVPPKRLKAAFADGGMRCDQPVSLVDLYPTLCELCDVPTPDDLDGQTLVPLLRDPKHSTGRAVVTMFDPGNLSMRTDRMRYIRYSDHSEELYNLRRDPNEWNNLIHDSRAAETLRSMRRRLSQ